jgi:hypothetical protein
LTETETFFENLNIFHNINLVYVSQRLLAEWLASLPPSKPAKIKAADGEIIWDA